MVSTEYIQQMQRVTGKL